MKKIIMALVAVFAISSSVLAQDCCKKGGKENLDKDAFAKQRTEKMVERYGLNEDQKAKLLEINKAFFAKYGKKGGCCKKDANAEKSCCKDNNKDSKKMSKKDAKKEDCSKCANKGKCDKKEQKSDCSKCPNANKANKEQVKADVAKYKSDVKNIFTKEQYQKYENDIKERVAKRQAAFEKQMQK